MASWATTKSPKARLGLEVRPLSDRMITVIEPAAKAVIMHNTSRSPKSVAYAEAILPRMTMTMTMTMAVTIALARRRSTRRNQR